ncbi:predicted protein [Histoplasma capsulatum var. duboisii H88]|uniref:Predicted protein n=2 Tax=Ajellomyces capsulatus TaxID=5037 RepID=F0UKZ0_AJEC8|nr:predicted protein [Histoplasma capsulatum H143]EGC46094.1 predicted protein [Histoplasma capsulatum var. duboisii H88]
MSSAELNCSVSLVRRLICYTDVDRWSKVNWFSTGQFNSVQQLHSRGPANMKLCEPSEWTVSRDEISYGKSLLKEHIVTQHEQTPPGANLQESWFITPTGIIRGQNIWKLFNLVSSLDYTHKILH